MKTYISKLNQHLLEKYPNIWNTKIVWMLAISLLIHLFFYIFGLLSLVDVELLHERNAVSNFFDNGAIFFSIIITVLLLVVWLLNLFKNNAFKAYYPTSRLKLFGQFFSYFIIIFCASTFYYSYMFGVKTYISSTYENHTITSEIKTTNNGALFFSKTLGNYTIDKLRYPDPFNDIYCETEHAQIDFNKAYLELFHYNYQFYSLNQLELKDSEIYIDSIHGGFVYQKSRDSSTVYFYKDSVIDVSDKIRTTQPSYFNYSKTFYTSKNKGDYPGFFDLNSYSHYSYYNNNQTYSRKVRLRNKKNYELLTRNNSNEIKQLLADVLDVSNTYKIKHNLTAEEWFKLIYHPDNFELTSFIRNEPKLNYEEDTLPIDYENIIDFDTNNDRTEEEQFFKDHITDYYIDSSSLYNVFENIEEIKNEDIVSENIHIFLWISFCIATLIFIFRVTGLRELLFSVITVGVLMLTVSLLTALFAYSSNLTDNSVGYFILYLTLIIGAIILLIPLFYASKLKKTIVGICLNISIAGFALYVLLIIGIISLHQDDACRALYKYGERYKNCFVLIERLGLYLSYILLIIGFIFIYLYSNTIKKWRALPEG